MEKVSRASKLPIQSIADLTLCGNKLAQSEMMGNINPAQGFVIASICQQTGMSYNEFAETYHIVGSRPSMRADTMLAKFLEMGGDYRLIQRDAQRAAVWMKFKSAEGEFSFSAEEAYQEPIAYGCKEEQAFAEMAKPLAHRKLKAKYKSPRSLMQMLWARVISDGVRTVCPGANKGSYTPEEVEDFEPSAAAHSSEPVPIDTSSAAVPIGVLQCPLDGPLYGAFWADMDLETLRFALEMDDAAITPEHRAEIERVIKEKEGNENV
jgi:hypothetical protein